MRLRTAALRQAVLFVGVTERPPGSNRGVLIDQWNMAAAGVKGVYWCCSFVHAMFDRVGYRLPGGASVAAVVAWARQDGYLVRRPRRGDLACFEFGEGAYDFGDHIGFVDRVLALRWANGRFTGLIRTIEGNTSAQNDRSGSQSNGGGVFRRWRWVRGVGATFVRVPG